MSKPINDELRKVLDLAIIPTHREAKEGEVIPRETAYKPRTFVNERLSMAHRLRQLADSIDAGENEVLIVGNVIETHDGFGRTRIGVRLDILPLP
jgi:hypothetical protein